MPTRRGSARMVCAALYLRRRGDAHLQPVRRLYVRLRAGPRNCGVDGAVLGRRVLPPGVLGRLWLLRVGERQRLRPLGQHDVFGNAQPGMRAAASPARRRAATTTTIAPARRARTTPASNTTRTPATATRGYDRTVNRRRADPAMSRARRNYNTYTGQRSTAKRCPAPARAAAPTTARAPRRPGPKAMRTSAAARRTTRIPARPTRGTPLARQQSLRRCQRQRLQEHGRRLAAAFFQRLGQRIRRHVVGRPRIAGAQRPATRRWRRVRRAPMRLVRWRRLWRRGGGGRSFGGFGGGGGFGGDRFGGGGFGGGGFRGGGRR